MIKQLTTLVLTAVTSTLLLTSCLEDTVASIAEGEEIFENYCADCHDLGEADGKFYLGVTYHLQDLEEFIQTEMPYEVAGQEDFDCDEQCATNVAAYIQSEMCENDTENLTLCDEDGVTGDQSIPNSDLGTKIALGALQFKYECSNCHDITPDQTDPNAVGANVFVVGTSTKYFSKEGLITFIEEEMPQGDATTCDADCAENVTIYLQSQYCEAQDTFAFCNGWEAITP